MGKRMFFLIMIIALMLAMLPFSVLAQDGDEMVVDVEPDHPAIKAFKDAWNEGYDPADVESFIHPDWVWCRNGEVAYEGIEGFLGWTTFFQTITPDTKVRYLEFTGEGNVYAARYVFTGTHTGSTETVPATGNELEFEMAGFFYIEDGKVKEVWNYFDSVAFFTALGLLPAPAE